jgi:hypothetical protein
LKEDEESTVGTYVAPLERTTDTIKFEIINDDLPPTILETLTVPIKILQSRYTLKVSPPSATMRAGVDNHTGR